jgi:hypothetical protein
MTNGGPGALSNQCDRSVLPLLLWQLWGRFHVAPRRQRAVLPSADPPPRLMPGQHGTKRGSGWNGSPADGTQLTVCEVPSRKVLGWEAVNAIFCSTLVATLKGMSCHGSPR